MDSNRAWAIWLAKQKEWEPTLPIRMLAELAHTKSHSQVQLWLKELVASGKAVRVKGYGKNRYRMVE